MREMHYCVYDKCIEKQENVKNLFVILFSRQERIMLEKSLFYFWNTSSKKFDNFTPFRSFYNSLGVGNPIFSKNEHFRLVNMMTQDLKLLLDNSSIKYTKNTK